MPKCCKKIIFRIRREGGGGVGEGGGEWRRVKEIGEKLCQKSYPAICDPTVKDVANSLRHGLRQRRMSVLTDECFLLQVGL